VLVLLPLLVLSPSMALPPLLMPFLALLLLLPP
jgi:hypothetical protein